MMGTVKLLGHAATSWRLAAYGLAVLGAAPAWPYASAVANEAQLLSNVRQLTFEGRRSGEGYFGRDGAQIVFQSDREPGNPFYQIYLLDLETGDTRRISPGTGKTTCAWIHPDGERVLYASTHEDPAAVDKQEAELALRAAGKARRYSWSFDEHYDIFESAVSGGTPRNLTEALGYDAEGSWSPDGEWIAFASNRHAYSEPLPAEDEKLFETDKSFMMDIYLMRADGSELRRLTTSRGYDGGPFFSADGKKIIWRRFSEDGVTAEVFTMNARGGGEKQITRLGAMSWAPFFHPSGAYAIFATNLQGFANFELYLVDADGRSEPVRVTDTEGFDGLPTFSPDGQTLSWTSSRTADKSAQIFLADWHHDQALTLLGLASGEGSVDTTEAGVAVAVTEAEISPRDIKSHVANLASEPMAGRLTGTEGERLASAYVADAFAAVGLAPTETGYFQEFEFTAGARLGADNRLLLGGTGRANVPVLNEDWRPLAFSQIGAVDEAEVVFAGYGIVAPEADGIAAHDSYGDLEVRDKWVLVLRYLPEDIPPNTWQHLFRYADLRFKAIAARDRGARGVIVVSSPNARVDEQLVPLRAGPATAAAGIAAITVGDAFADDLLTPSGKSLTDLQSALDRGDTVPAFTIPGLTLAANIDIAQEKRRGRNVLGRILAGSEPGATTVIVGAHLDHLGRGSGGDSLARADEAGKIHFGADDNASGVAALIEIAEYLVDQQRRGKFQPVHDILFAAWSGEELGMLGSTHFVRALGAGGDRPTSLRPGVIAYLNMDMIGRLDTSVALQGLGSSSVWRGEIERRNAPIGLAITPVTSSYLPTDATVFYLRGVPILNAFTGAHPDYHTPRDTADKLNYSGAAKIARLMGLLTRAMALRAEPPDYVRAEDAPVNRPRRTSRVYLGTVPDYVAEGVTGVRLSGVVKGGPAEAAGIEGGDVIVELAGREVETIHDYSYALDVLKIGEPARMIVDRGGKRLSVEITPASRE